ncbi:AP-1 complex subunit gamma-1 [Tritrichomonas musculus]|uniref:AP-1 complex subunit gamma n=1 Tax=Tritrichomonas musculus TaxID=1915356 RepID=A0ABR2LA53_9EUKA
MTQSLNDFISSIRMAETIEQEKFLIATEQAQIRAYCRKMDPEMRPRVVSKLVFLDMIGQNTAWGQMEAITLMTYDKFSYKKIGYICTGILLDQTAELTVLVTQTLLKDLQNTDPNIIYLALSFIANLGNAEVCRSVSTTVQKLFEHRSTEVMKAAGMATVRIIRTNPDLADSYKNSVQSLLNNQNHGVVIAGINLVLEMIHTEPKYAKSWSQFAIPFTKILKSLNQTRPTREFSYSSYNDPYMQIKTMQALSLIRKRSEELDGILQSIISCTKTRQNTGRAILYQAVETIVALSRKSSLRGLAFNQVGRLLSLKDPNVLYSALSSFARVLYAGKSIINRGSVDSMALQRYKTQIVQCLDHQDPSIRRRALDVISALIDEKNVETLIPEILAYVRLADAEFRSELIAKIYSATQRFAPTNEWNFDTVHQILIDSGNYLSADIMSSFCQLIANTPSLQPHAVQKLSESLLNFSDNQNLMQVAAYVIGEFATSENGVCETLKNIIVMPQTTSETKLYAVTALSKLAVRFGLSQPISEYLKGIISDNNLEVQQRAGELVQLLSMGERSYEFLAPVPSASVNENDDSSIKINSNINAQTAQGSKENAEGDGLLIDILNMKGASTSSNPSQQTQPQQQKRPEDMDLLDSLMSDLTPTTSTSNLNAPSRSSELLNDISFTPSQSAPSTSAPTSQQLAAPQQPITQAQPQPQPQQQQASQVELMRTQDFVIFGQTRSNPNDKRQYALRLIIYNLGNSQLDDFKLAFTPSVGWQINPQPPDRSSLLPKGGTPTTQIVYLLNMNNAPFQIQTKATYKFGSQPLTEKGVITKIPPPI